MRLRSTIAIGRRSHAAIGKLDIKLHASTYRSR